MPVNPQILVDIHRDSQIKPLTTGANNPAQLNQTGGEQATEQVQKQLGTGDDEQPRF